MIEIWKDPLQMLAAIPLLGSLLGLAFRSMPRILKTWAFLVALATLLVLMGISGGLTVYPAGKSLMFFLLISSLLAILGQSWQKDVRVVLPMILFLLGMGIGFMANPGGVGVILLAILMGFIILLLIRQRKFLGREFGWGMGVYGIAIICLLFSLFSGPDFASYALLLAYAVLLPLFPLQGGYVAALVGLPGTLPAFLAVLLPILGFHGMSVLVPGLPAWIFNTAAALSLLGALYATLRALVQDRMAQLLAYASLASFSILWWYLAATRFNTQQAVIYFIAIVFVTNGLFLTRHGLQTRYGDLPLNRMSGLAHPMPRFATLLSLLIMAAMGLPFFGLFSGYMEMLFKASITLSGGVLVILFTWLMASWYFLNLMQQILFGPHRQDVVYEDLRHTEVVSLLLVLFVLVALGIMPQNLFEPGMVREGIEASMEVTTWNR